IPAEILYAEAVTGGANHVASAAFQTRVAHLFPQRILYTPGRNAPHGGSKMAGLLLKMVFRLYLQSLSLRHFVFRSWAEEVWNTRHRGVALFTSNLDEVALTQVGQLNVITAA